MVIECKKPLAQIAASLQEMKGSVSSAENQSTIEEAANLILDRGERIAELENRLKQVCALCIKEKDLALVAKGGETIMVDSGFAQSSSTYFATALTSGFVESGTKSVSFEDVDMETLRFVVCAMHAGKEGAHLIELPDLDATSLLKEIVGFCSRLCMPWIAEAAAQIVLESKHVPALIDLVIIAHGCAQILSDNQACGAFGVEAGRASYWGEVCEAAAKQLATRLEEAVTGGSFTRLPLELLGRILEHVKDLEWSGWHEYDVPAEGGRWESDPSRTKGFSLHVKKSVGGGVGVYVCLSEEGLDEAVPVAICASNMAGIDLQIRAMPNIFIGKEQTSAHFVVKVGSGAGWLHFPKSDHFLHGNSFKIAFRYRLSKLHRQCQAILACSKALLSSEPQTEPLVVATLKLLRSRKGLEAIYAMLVEFMSMAAFKGFSVSGMLERMPCSDVKAIITHPSLNTLTSGEIEVLKAVLRWAMCKHQETLCVGAEVRVKPDSKHESWRGADCRVTQMLKGEKSKGKKVHEVSREVAKIQFQQQEEGGEEEDQDKWKDGEEEGENNMYWEVVRISNLSEEEETEGEVLYVKESEVMSPGEAGLERLLPHVRFPFITVEQIKTLDEKMLSFANKSETFLHLVEEAVNVQLGKLLAEKLDEERGKKRAKARVVPSIDSKCIVKHSLGS